MISHSLCLSHRVYKVCYVVYHTYCVPCHEFGKGVRQRSGSGSLDNGQSQLPKRTKEIFLGYGGDKEFAIKGYIDASFGTDLDDSKSQSRYLLNMGAIIQSSSMQSIVDIGICKIHTDLNVADPLTKLLSQAKHDHTLVLFRC